jgi:hypothetical protein
VARLGAAYAQGFAGDPSRHGVLSAGAGGVIPLGDRALSVHVRGGMVEALGDAPVPFDELLSPSGAGGLRGLPRGRLRGPSELVASLEYRWLLTLWMDAMLFVDRGNAYGPRFSGLTPGRAFTTGGLALMVIGNEAADYRRNNPLFGVQLAVTADDGLNYSLAFVVH